MVGERFLPVHSAAGRFRPFVFFFFGNATFELQSYYRMERMSHKTGIFSRIFVLLLMTLGLRSQAALPATQPSTAQSMDGKVFVGYQGWFAPQDASGKWVWWHYGRGGSFSPGTAASTCGRT